MAFSSSICRRLPRFISTSISNSCNFNQLIALNATFHSNSATNVRSSSSFSRISLDSAKCVNNRCVSQLVSSDGDGERRLFLVDTTFLVKRLEGEGYTANQAVAITVAIREVLNESLENVAHIFMTNPEIQLYEKTKESNLATFKSEIQGSQEHHFSILQRETEKLQGDIEKLRSDLKYEMDKVTAGQRLDLNLEKGRIRDELAKQSEETTNLTTKLDKEIQFLRAQLEVQKSEVLKHCIGTLASIFAVGVAVVCVLL